ncbi:membrane-targeted effector domain-containing toxin [Pseudomonas lurida]|uniref:membrane-targeted effector domain-containing toxin n=1 Tax=Pseudomonas lurida TaxID=244566 RepID=UPI00178343EE|nr:membrane-targeted effector domain-containing toxin [Pseudomonas lurida]MBD8669026.1 membrane-targeted effector domain-containing toxin [Pseudomonas lurida]UZQ75462.1 membrane-targeted effector domain-containing toxin [Pseudomonas lurida]
MSTVIPPAPAPSFSEIKGYLNLIGHHLFEQPAPLLPQQSASAEQLYLQGLNDKLRAHNQVLAARLRELYQSLEQADLQHADGKGLLARLRSGLNAQVQALLERSVIDGKGLRSFSSHDAGIRAFENEARRDLADRLLHPEMARLVTNVSLGPAFRPGVYALTFAYQYQPVAFAGAFVLTVRNSPVVTSLTGDDAVGNVLLFHPLRGIEVFDSLAGLDRYLRGSMDSAAARAEYLALLPRRYQSLGPAGIWPLTLTPITGEPLFEHVFDALKAKREQDIEWALDLVDNPGRSAREVVADLDLAIQSTLPDLGPRLALHAQRLLDRCLRYSAPDWYRSADAQRRGTLAELLRRYDQARAHVINLMGPAATPPALARYQLIEQLAEDLDIHDLDPDRLQVSTRRTVAGVGDYEQSPSLSLLALRGLHTGDETPGSAFLTKTTLTYDRAPLSSDYQDLTPTYLATLLGRLQPRLDFAAVQRDSHTSPVVKQAIESMLEHRLCALAYTSLLQNHLGEGDYALIQALRQGTGQYLSAATVSFHEAQLNGFWLLRQTDADGGTQRLLLCTPQAPVAQQFLAFDNEASCKAHLLGWCMNPAMKDYVISTLALRFRPSMHKILAGLSFMPHAQEHHKVSFTFAPDYAASLKAMAQHLLATRDDDRNFATPLWYRSASLAQRQALTTLAQDTEGALRAYNAHPQSPSQFPSFATFVHGQAKARLNALLGQQDVDPDTVWAHYPQAFPGLTTPPSMTYTQLYRDGYQDNVGFLDPKFETSATFTGPVGVDLSRLTPEAVARSVRGVWVGQRYADEVRGKLQSPGSPGYGFRRDATLAISQLQMRNAALESRLQGHIAQADFEWLDTCLQNLGNASAQVRESYQVHRLFVDGDWVIDTFLFKRGHDPVLLYTPNAPDGVSFREARLFNYMLKHVDGMVGYFAERVGMQSKVRVRAFLENARQQLPQTLDRTHPSPGRHDSIRRETVLLNLRQALYDAKLQRKIDDVEATTVNRTQMIMDVVWAVIEPLVAIATAPYPVLSLSLGMLLAFKDGMLALHAYNQGQMGEAFGHYLGYLLNSAGAVFTDLRPALSMPWGKPMRPLLHTASQEQALSLVRQLHTPATAIDDLQAVLFQGQALWTTKQPDALGRFLLLRHDPLTGRWQSTGRLAIRDTQGRWVRSGVTGGAPKYEKLPVVAAPLQRYEAPPALLKDLEYVVSPNAVATSVAGIADNFGADSGRSVIAKNLSHLREPYAEAVANLALDAKAHFDALAPLVPRADVLSFDSNTLAPVVLQRLLSESKGLIVGASVDSIASKQLLIQQMRTLYEQGVRRLYIEFLPADVFRAKLDKLKTAKVSKTIDQHLKAVDKAMATPADSPYSYRALVLAAREHGIEVKALDASTSYFLDDALSAGATSVLTPRENRLRNFYSHKVIANDVAASPDDSWVALVDHRRMNTHDQVPGLAELHNTVSLRVEDVGAGSPTGVWKDTPGAIAGDSMAKADFKISLQTAYSKSTSQVLAPAAQHSYSAFEIPAEMRDAVIRLKDTAKGLDSRYFPGDPELRPAYSVFQQTREKLDAAATAHFKDYVPPAKPVQPLLSPGLTAREFFERAYAQSNGVLIGEAHSGRSSKALLIKELKAMKVKTLYVEHLFTDLHQADLDALYRGAPMSRALKDYLRIQDRGHMLGYDGPHTYTALIETAAKYKIRLHALDCLASYRVEGMQNKAQSRAAMFSYFANEVITQDQLAHGPHRWAALVGNSHTDTYLGIPGVANMQGAISLHVNDVALSQPVGLRAGRWETAHKAMRPDEWVALRSDFALDVAVAGHKPSDAFTPADRSRLTQTGYFLIDRPTPAQTLLIHRSRTGEIVTTPIQVDETGRFFVDRWEPLRSERYVYQYQLIHALQEFMGLRPAP